MSTMISTPVTTPTPQRPYRPPSMYGNDTPRRPYRPPSMYGNDTPRRPLSPRRLDFNNIQNPVSKNELSNLKLGNISGDCICSICLNEDNENMGSLPCGHTFHHNCVRNWFIVSLRNNTYSCPNCRCKGDIHNIL